MTTVRGTYTAGTPQVTTFEVQPTSPLGEAVVRSASRGHSSRVFENPEFQRYSRLKNGYGRVKVVLKNNSGMFLVASSQAFFSLMNVAVKKLNSLDTPVPAFEVSVILFIRSLHGLNPLFSLTADFGQDGKWCLLLLMHTTNRIFNLQGITWLCCVTYMYVPLQLLCGLR